MKKIVQIVLLGMACFLLIGCGKEQDGFKLGSESTYEIQNDVVRMAIKKGTLTRKSATIVLENHTEDTYLYGDSYSIECEKVGKWYLIEPLEQMNFVMIASILNPGATKEIEIDWNRFYGTLPAGKYRIVKSVSLDRKKEDAIYLSVEFTIE